MFGWFSAAAARASFSNRPRRSASPEKAAGRILMATSRPRRGSRARYTSPMPPVPTSDTISYGPSLAPAEKAIYCAPWWAHCIHRSSAIRRSPDDDRIFLVGGHVRKLHSQVPRVGRIEVRGSQGDGPCAHQLFELAVEVLHAFQLAVAHRIQQRLAFFLALFQIVARAHRRLQHFDDGDAASAFFGDQSLRDEIAERRGEARPHRLLVACLERADDALDGLRGVDRVKRGEHQVTRFRRRQRDFDGFAVAHLAHQNHLRRLTQGGPERQRKGRRVGVQLTLVDRAFLVRSEEHTSELQSLAYLVCRLLLEKKYY